MFLWSSVILLFGYLFLWSPVILLFGFVLLVIWSFGTLVILLSDYLFLWSSVIWSIGAFVTWSINSFALCLDDQRYLSNVQRIWWNCPFRVNLSICVFFVLHFQLEEHERRVVWSNKSWTETSVSLEIYLTAWNWNLDITYELLTLIAVSLFPTTSVCTSALVLIFYQIMESVQLPSCIISHSNFMIIHELH